LHDGVSPFVPILENIHDQEDEKLRQHYKLGHMFFAKFEYQRKRIGVGTQP